MPDPREPAPAAELSDAGWIDVVAAVGWDESNDQWSSLQAAICAAAPHLIAAELDRLIANTRELATLPAADQWDIGWREAIDCAAKLLAERAAALRGEHRDTDSTSAHVHTDACMCVMAPMEVEGAYECNHCGDHYGGVCTALCDVARREFDLAHPARQWAVRHPDVSLSVHRSPHSVLYTASKLPGGVIVTRLAGQEEWVPETNCLCGDRKPVERHFEGCPDTTPSVREPRVWKSDADPEPDDRPTIRDAMGDVWTNDPNLYVTPDTQPMTWSRIAKKYGPLTEVLPVSTPGGGS